VPARPGGKRRSGTVPSGWPPRDNATQLECAVGDKTSGEVFDGPAAVSGKHDDEHHRRTGDASEELARQSVGDEPANVTRLTR
jgi:hypothetical protein